MDTLFLTAAEEPLLVGISEDVRSGWTVKQEKGLYEDTYAKLQVRMGLLRLHDPFFLSLRERIRKAPSLEAAAEMIRDTDMRKVNEDDLASLFFALGPDILSQVIRFLLLRAATDDDMKGIAALSTVRHEILASYQAVSAS